MTATFTDSGQARVARVLAHIAKVGAAYGPRSDDYRTMQDSWAYALSRVVELGGTVTPDGGGLSLYVVTDYGMHVGVIFTVHSGYRDGKAMGDYGCHTQWCAAHWNVIAAGTGTCFDDGHAVGGKPGKPCRISPDLVPVAGTWSLHS